MSSPHRVRAATHADVPAIALIHVRSWHATYGAIFPQQTFDEFPLPSREALWRGAVAASREQPGQRLQVLVAEHSAQLAGFVALGPFRVPEGAASAEPTLGEVRALYLLPQLQRQGIGRALFEAGCGWLRAAGFTEMRLWVIQGNPALHFYRALGGREVERATFDTHGVTIEEVCCHYAL